MSKAKKCDRCGVYYTPSSTTRSIHEYFEGTSSMTKNSGDVCEKCAGKFVKWWAKGKKVSDER